MVFEKDFDKSEITDRFKMQEIVRRHPQGLFYYYCEDEKSLGQVERILTAELPGRQVVVTNEELLYVAFRRKFSRSNRFFEIRSCLFPADFGTEVNGSLFTNHESQDLLDNISLSLGIRSEVIKEFLPEIRKERSPFEGGKNIEVAGSDKVYTISKSLSLLEPDRFYFLPKLHELFNILQKTGRDSSRPKDVMSTGHIDLSISAVKAGGQLKFYVNQDLYNCLKDWALMDEELSGAFLVSKDSVEAGGLNIKYVNGVALVPSMRVVDVGLLRDLTGLGYKIVELGEEQFDLKRAAGVKCRSLKINWRSR